MKCDASQLKKHNIIMRRFLSFILYSLVFVFSFLGKFGILYTSAETQCEFQNGQCIYQVNLSPTAACSSSPTFETVYKPEEIRLPADQKMGQMQKDFDTVKSDHENRIKELEHSIQKILRNALSSGPPMHYGSRHVHIDSDIRERNTIEETPQIQDGSASTLLLQLQNQFNNMRKSLSERTADLLEARNKLNETTDLLNAAQKQAFESNSKLVSFETTATVLERENRILKNKLKDKTERLDYANEMLNTTEHKLINVENQLYDVIRSEATLREELETLKVILNKTQMELQELKKNHSELEDKYKRAKLNLKVREEELIECYKAKTQTFCGFEDPDLCGFTQDNFTDTFNWERMKGQTPSANTGPENDHTCKSSNGHYMYIEASGKSKGHNAKMYSPMYRGLNPQCIEFYYHMHGRQVGTLTVHSKLLTEDEFRAIWRVFGNQGNLWIKASISVSEETARSGYQLIFEGITDLGYEGDISLDDFRIKDGRCASDAASLEATPAPKEEREMSQLLQDQIDRYRKILRRRQRLRSGDRTGSDED